MARPLRSNILSAVPCSLSAAFFVLNSVRMKERPVAAAEACIAEWQSQAVANDFIGLAPHVKKTGCGIFDFDEAALLAKDELPSAWQQMASERPARRLGIDAATNW